MNERFSWLRRLFPVSLLAGMVSLGLLGGAFGATQPGPVKWDELTADDAAPRQLLVRYDPAKTGKDGGPVRHAIAAHRRLGATVQREYNRIPWQVVQVPARVTLAEAAAIYEADPAVVSVEPNYIFSVDAMPNDPRFSELWGMQRIGAVAAWDVTTGDREVVVAVIDTGIRYTHEDIVSNMWVNPSPTFGDIYGANWTSGDGSVTSGDPMDDHGHGTHVAGTIGAVGHNNTGVVGVNWKVRLMALKFLGKNGKGSTADAIAAIEYAIDNGAHLSNNSWGGGGYSEALQDMIAAAAAANQLFVAAAGNDTNDNDAAPHYPSSYDLDNIIAVASITSSGALSSFSNYGATTVHLAAPGSDILSCKMANDASYGSSSGTSMASPHVAGAAALMLSLQPAISYHLIRDAILDNVAPNPQLAGRVITDGELALDKALASLLGSIKLDRMAYRSDAMVTVTVNDAAQPDGFDVVTVNWEVTAPDGTVRSSGTADLDRDSGTTQFVGGLQLVTGTIAEDGDLLTVSFIDGRGDLLVATAPIDDIPPQIMNLRIDEVSDERMVVRWETDEPATSGSRLGTAVPVSDNEKTSEVLVTEHALEYLNLNSFTRYYAAVWSEDAAGNRSYEPADTGSTDTDDYPAAMTRGRVEVYRNNFELSTLGWEADNPYGSDVCWQYGTPRFGPKPTTRCWGTVINGRHPNMVNATLTSPPIKVKDWPVIRFNHWADMAFEEIFRKGDFGVIEVLLNGGWENVTQYSDRYSGQSLISGSGGWQAVTVRLPQDFANQTLRVRFRFQADEFTFEGGNPAGWYIDDFAVSEVQFDGVMIESLTIDDTVGGDGDGQLGPGETGTIAINIANFTGRTLENLNGVVVIRSYGAADEQPQLTNGSPALVYYDTVIMESIASAHFAAPLDVTLPETIKPGTKLSLFQTLRDSESNVYEMQRVLTVTGDGLSITGITSDNTVGSVAINDDGIITPLDGNSISGMVTCDYYADNGGRPAPPVLGTIASNATVVVENILGQEIARVKVDDSGNYQIDGLPEEALWVYVLPPDDTPRMVPPSGVSIEVSGDMTQDFVLRHDGIEAPYDVAPRLSLVSVSFDDATYGNGDGRIDPGEKLVVNVKLSNIGAGTAAAVTGVLDVVDMLVPDVMSVVAGEASDPKNIPGTSNQLHPVQLTPSFEVEVNAGVQRGVLQRFVLWVTDTGSVPARSWPFNFSLRVDDRISLSGSVVFADGRNTAEHYRATTLRLRVGPSNEFERVTGVAADGSYHFKDILRSDVGELAVIAVPGDYALPSVIALNSLDDDIVMPQIEIPLAPLSLPSGISLTITEGTSATETFTVENSGSSPLTINVDKRYLRTQSEVQAPVTPMMAGVSSAGASLGFEKIDWSKVSAETHSLNKLVVRFAEGTTRAEQETILNQGGLAPIFFFNSFPAALVRRVQGAASVATLAAQATELESDSRVLLAAPSDRAYRMNKLVAPDDPMFGDMYNFYNNRQTGGSKGADIRAQGAWGVTTGSHEVVVAVCDSGVDITHPDLRDNIWRNPYPGTTDGVVDDYYGYNFYDMNNDITDLFGYGTMAAGIIGASGSNGEGVVGVNWSVSIMVCRLTDWTGDFTEAAYIAKAIEYAVENGAQVSNLGWGSYDTAGVIGSVLDYAAANNHIVVTGAGNEALDLDKIKAFPAYYSVSHPNVITVTATDHHDELAYFSNFGAESVQIAAPGVRILSTALYGDYAIDSGTTLASAHVAGAAALLWSLNPSAPYQLIMDGLLKGSRYNPNLEGWVATAGHLDLERAIATLGTDWLTLQPQTLTINPGVSAEVTIVVNDPPSLVARVNPYQAEITLTGSDGAFKQQVPLSVKVNSGLWLEVAATRIVNLEEYADTLPPSPGDQVELWVKLHNLSSAGIGSVAATISGGGGSTISQGTANWSYIYGKDTEEAEEPFLVTLDPSATADLTFDLAVTVRGNSAGTYQITVPLAAGAKATGRVITAPEGDPIVDARVEVWGAGSGHTVTLPDGSFLLRGLADGDYKLRVIPLAHERSAELAFTVGGNDVTIPDVELHAPDVNFTTGTDMLINLFHGATNTVMIDIANAEGTAAGDFNWSAYLMPLRRVALVSDGQTLSPLLEPLSAMGFDTFYFTNNFDRVQFFQPTDSTYELVQNPVYSDDASFYAQYDAVILDISGPNGYGRLLTVAEYTAISEYINRGGVVIVSGVNPLSYPDNSYTAWLAGVESLDRATNRADTATASADLVLPFVSIETGDNLTTTLMAYDKATLQGGGQAEALFTVDGNNKLIRRDSAGGGTIYLWTGNRSDADWSAQGLWQDVLRGILWQKLINGAASAVTWATVTATDGVIVAGASQQLPVEINTAAPLTIGTHEAALLFIGNYPGADVRAVRLTLETQISTFRAFTTGTVTDSLGNPLLGDGSVASDVFQVIWAGPDGVVDPPALDGAPTGDDVLLSVALTGLPEGRFGVGNENIPDIGRFNEVFVHNIPTDADASDIYVRAWDGVSFDGAFAYGDSHLYTFTFQPDEAHDFGSWGVTNVLRYGRDANGDSIPDGWMAQYRPDIDPELPIGPLDSEAIYGGKLPIFRPDGQDPAAPWQVVATTNLIFALDRDKARIVVTNLALQAEVSVFGSIGSANGQFYQPEGLSIDPRPGQNRLAVADTSNNRIQILTFDPVTGEISWQANIGSYGTENGQFDRPAGVSIELETGNIYVADTKNNRIQVFRANGNFIRTIVGSGDFEMWDPQGVAADPDFGIFVADTLNRQVLHFSSLGVPLTAFGSEGGATDQFWLPVDIRVWRHERPDGTFANRLAVSDKYANRIKIFATDGTYLVSVGGYNDDNGQLNNPSGSFPMPDSNLIYVADTGNKRVQWFNVVIDADGDGMDDLWEEMNGLDPTRDDSQEDPDGDGLSNLGEYRGGTNPHDPDTNGNGINDQTEMYHGYDPSAPNNDLDPNDIPVYAAFFADNASVVAESNVVITVVVNKALPAEAEMWLTLSGASPMEARRMQSADNITYVYTHQTRAGE
ncbi:MAG: S8 family serine peptidase [Lentisphaerae bacterium]|nr:S8 family serine peptidase [Lentisphaerota bacterium]